MDALLLTPAVAVGVGVLSLPGCMWIGTIDQPTLETEVLLAPVVFFLFAVLPISFCLSFPISADRESRNWGLAVAGFSALVIVPLLWWAFIILNSN